MRDSQPPLHEVRPALVAPARTAPAVARHACGGPLLRLRARAGPAAVDRGQPRAEAPLAGRRPPASTSASGPRIDGTNWSVGGFASRRCLAGRAQTLANRTLR